MSNFDIRWAISDGIRGSISLAELCIGVHQFKKDGTLFKCRCSQTNHLHLIRWLTIVVASNYLTLSLGLHEPLYFGWEIGETIITLIELTIANLIVVQLFELYFLTKYTCFIAARANYEAQSAAQNKNLQMHEWLTFYACVGSCLATILVLSGFVLLLLTEEARWRGLKIMAVAITGIVGGGYYVLSLQRLLKLLIQLTVIMMVDPSDQMEAGGNPSQFHDVSLAVGGDEYHQGTAPTEDATPTDSIRTKGGFAMKQVGIGEDVTVEVEVNNNRDNIPLDTKDSQTSKAKSLGPRNITEKIRDYTTDGATDSYGIMSFDSKGDLSPRKNKHRSIDVRDMKNTRKEFHSPASKKDIIRNERNSYLIASTNRIRSLMKLGIILCCIGSAFMIFLTIRAFNTNQNLKDLYERTASQYNLISDLAMYLGLIVNAYFQWYGGYSRNNL
eukprot:jgi/Bigna1/91962/estExt_fgenesh1_pg.C_1380010